jgi:hypothetical protein
MRHVGVSQSLTTSAGAPPHKAGGGADPLESSMTRMHMSHEDATTLKGSPWR